jgi:hypothetical protein
MLFIFYHFDGLGNCCSIHLSYGATEIIIAGVPEWRVPTVNGQIRVHKKAGECCGLPCLKIETWGTRHPAASFTQ